MSMSDYESFSQRTKHTKITFISPNLKEKVGELRLTMLNSTSVSI